MGVTCHYCGSEMFEMPYDLADVYYCPKCGGERWVRLEDFRRAIIDLINPLIRWTGWQFLHDR